jgi:putative spermidine/putrescine transport system substrate-binding protein
MKKYADAAAAGQFHSLYTSNSQLQQLLVSGDVWLVPYFRGIALPWARDGAPVAYAVPREGQVAFPEGFQLVKGSSAAQQKAAGELVDLMLEPQNVLDYCQTAAVLPLMKNVVLPPALANDPAVQPDAIAKAIKFDWGKIATNSPKWQEAWNRDVKAHLR